jgi:hypothetical protein
VVTRRLSNRARRVTMVATILIACGVWTLIRTGGFTGDFDHDFAWRWSETAEERLLAQAQEDPVATPSISAPAKTSDEPVAPAATPPEKTPEEPKRSRGSRQSKARPGITRCWSAMSCSFATVRRWPHFGFPPRAIDEQFA